MNSTIRLASHKKYWYSDDKIILGKQLSEYFADSERNAQYNSLKSIIVPHSGLRYGGPTAAKAFINVNPDNFDRAVILGPSHHKYFEGGALTTFNKFETPFGNIDVDTKTTNYLLKDSEHFFPFPQSDDVQEHSIEMELPFLKYIFQERKFTILPMVIGHGDFDQNKELAKCLYDLYEDPKTLFVISSDFCHWGRDFRYTYYNNKFKTVWESTQDLDNQALNIISEMDSKKFDNYIKNTKNTICGRNPITIILSIIEEYQKKHQNKKISFDKAGYAQSDKVMNMNGRSVSYAAGVNFIS